MSSSSNDGLSKAQALCWKAMGSWDPEERVSLAREALQESADCADAYSILAHDASADDEEAKGY